MASQPPYPIDDMPTSDDAPAPETETTSPPTEQSAVAAPEIPPDLAPDPVSAEPVTNTGDPARWAPPATPGADPAPVAPFGPKSVRGGNMSMRVLSRAMQDLDVVTGGKRAATYDEVDEYVDRAIRTEQALERAAIAAWATSRQPAGAPAMAGDLSGPGDQSTDQPGDAPTTEAPPSRRIPDGGTSFGEPHAQSAVYWRRPKQAPADTESSDGMDGQPNPIGAPRDDPTLQQVDLRPFDFGSPYVKRSNHYWELQAKLEKAGDRDTYYFESVARMTANLANMDGWAYGGQADLDPQVRAYSEKLSQAIADFNDGQVAKIISGTIPERGTALDSKLVVDEQKFIQSRLDNLRKTNKILYDDFVRGINRNANVTGWKSWANSITDEAVHRAAEETRRILGRPINFATSMTELPWAIK
ncbi:hypothetical protein GCM10009087_01740 [Sphingomonas oligophenolica]|uniref:Uncharacterized protein n=1 Tax=Sphingomonas oligophenolica TaxID=301154 RepID=A0ABU9Y128_9SPHN